MKKVFITMLAFLAISTSVMADGHVDSVRYLTTKAWKNWFVSVDATCNWWQGSMRTPEAFTKNYTLVEWGRPTIGFNVSVGKWINHKVAVRLGYSNTQIHSYIQGGITVHKEHLRPLYVNPETAYDQAIVNGQLMEIYQTSMRYHRLQADFMFSPIDFFQGYYNENRVWTPVLYVSGGCAHTSKDFFALKTMIDNGNALKEDPNDELEPHITGNNFELVVGAGLTNNFRLGTHWDINLDLNWTTHKWTIDSWTYEFTESNSSVRPKRFDNMYTASLGLTYYFTREYDLPVNCCNEMDSIKKKLDEFINMPAENNEAQPCDTIVKFVNIQTEDVLSYPFSIFFNRDSYQLMSRRDLVNLREIANVAKENGYKLLLRGSCDSATASAAYNQTLSENRCLKIQSELMQMGVPESQIILEPKGGVKELDPTEYDRRVLIQLVKEAQK